MFLFLFFVLFFFSFSFYSLCLLFCLHFESRLIFMFIDSTVVRYKTMVGPLPEIWIYSHHPETCFIILLVIAVLLFWLVSEQKIAAGGVKRPHSSSVPIIHSFVAEGSPKKKKEQERHLSCSWPCYPYITLQRDMFISFSTDTHLITVSRCCFCWGCRQWLVGAEGRVGEYLRILLCISSEFSNYNKSKLSRRLNAVDQGRLGSRCSTLYRWKRKWLSAVAVITPIDPLATKARLSNKGQKRLIYLSFPSSLSQMLLHVRLFSLSFSFLSPSLSQYRLCPLTLFFYYSCLKLKKVWFLAPLLLSKLEK